MMRTFSTLCLTLMLVGTGTSQTPPPTANENEQKGRELFRSGKVAESLAQLQLAVKANPQLPPAKVMLADLFLKAGNGPQARIQLEQAAAEDPENPEVLAFNGQIALAEGRVTDAILNCQAALQAAQSPRWDAAQRKKFARVAHLGLATGYQTRRDYKSARTHVQAVLIDDPKNGPIRQQAAAIRFFLDQPDEAYKEFLESFSDDPTLDPPELSLASLWDGKGKPDEAEKWFKKAAELRANSEKVARGYARWLMDRGRIADAKPYLDSAAKLDPSSRETTALLGLAARYRKDFVAAEKIFEEMSRNAPADAFAAWNLAISLAESDDAKKRQRAIDIAEVAFRQNSRSAEGIAVLGWCYFKAGRIDEADKALRAAAGAGPVARDTAYYLSKVLAEKGNTADAKRALKDSILATGPFVYKSDAEKFLADLEKKP